MIDRDIKLRILPNNVVIDKSHWPAILSCAFCQTIELFREKTLFRNKNLFRNKRNLQKLPYPSVSQYAPENTQSK